MPPSAIKQKSEPSHLFVYLYAIGMAAFGVLIGMLYLMSFPMTAYSSIEDRARDLEGRESLDPVPGDAFYIEGPTLRSRIWEAKRKQLIEGSVQTITVTEGEINAWFEAKFRGSTPTNDDDASGLVLVPDVPNLGISEEGTVYLNLPADITGYGLDGNYVLSAQVHFSSGAPAKLKVDHLQIGGASVPLPGQLGAHIVSTVIKGFKSAEEYAVFSEAWERVESVEVLDDALVFTLNTP
jgi:hypothetical protein